MVIVHPVLVNNVAEYTPHCISGINFWIRKLKKWSRYLLYFYVQGGSDVLFSLYYIVFTHFKRFCRPFQIQDTKAIYNPTPRWNRRTKIESSQLFLISYWYLTNLITVPPKVSPFYAEDTLHVGDRASLTCSVTKGDTPLTITWHKDGRTLGPAQMVTIKQVDAFTSILAIESLTSDHNGNYSCVVANAAAEVSHTHQLVVNGKDGAPCRVF